MKAKLEFVLMCHIVLFISYSLAVDTKQKITTSTSNPEISKRGFYSGRLPWIDGPYKFKTDNQTFDFPPELWVMVLKNLRTFPNLVNAILGKVRFETAVDAPKFYIEFGCEDLHLLHNEIANNPEEAQKHFKSTLLLYKKFLRSPIYKDATFVLLWKLTSMLTANLVGEKAKYFNEIDRLVEISELAIPYVRENIEKKKAVTQVEIDKYKKRKENFVKYAEHLTFLDHGCILKSVIRQFPYQITGWMNAGYALILENSKHLENRLSSFKMMGEFVEVYFAGNGLYILLINSPEWTLNETSSGSEWTLDMKQDPAKTSESKVKHSKASDELQLKNRFEINWDFFKGQLTDEDKQRYILQNSKAAMFTIHKYYREFGYEKRENFYYAFVTSAFSYLIVNQMPKNTKDFHMNFALFDLAKDDLFVEKCRKWLMNKFQGTELLETGFEDQVAILDGFQSRKELGVVDAYNAVIDVQTFGKQNRKIVEYFWELVNSFSQRCDPKHTQNFTDLIKMMKVALYTRTENLDLIYQIQHIIVSSMQHPHLSNNLSDEFFEMDELHSILLLRNEDKMLAQAEKDDGSVRVVWGNLFRKTFDDARWIFDVNPNETNKDHKKRRFFLKLLCQLSLDAFENTEIIDQSDINRIIEVHKLIYRLTKRDDLSETSLIRDIQLMSDCLLECPFEGAEDLHWEYVDENNLDFNFVYKPFNETGASEKNPLVFLCILNTLFARDEYELEPHDQLMENYIKVEANMGKLDEFDPIVRRTISTITFFQLGFMGYPKPYKHLKFTEFIDSMIRLLMGLRVDASNEDYNVLDSIHLAILESGIVGNELKSKLGKESIELLVEYHQRLYVLDKDKFKEKLRRCDYEDVRELFGFELVEPKEGQSNTV